MIGIERGHRALVLSLFQREKKKVFSPALHVSCRNWHQGKLLSGGFISGGAKSNDQTGYPPFASAGASAAGSAPAAGLRSPRRE